MTVMLSACSEDDYKLYDTTQKDSVFLQYRNEKDELVNNMEYAFNFDVAQSHTVELPVSLMGMPKDHDRVISIVPVEEESDMVEGKNYTITNNIIPANAVEGTIHVNLIRNEDPDILNVKKTLVLTISENNDLKSVGENKFTITYSDIRPETRPLWWSTFQPLPVYSYENAQLFFEYFYRLAPEANPATFEEMMELYGDYFTEWDSNKIAGPVARYTAFLRQHVLIPLYKEHPEVTWQKVPTF